MSSLSGEQPRSTEESDSSRDSSNFTAPTADVKRKNRLTGLFFLALVLVILSISIWRRFFS